jgi:hypothetical protein
VCPGLFPLTLAYGIGGFHDDMPSVLCVMAAVACLLPTRPRRLMGASIVNWDRQRRPAR